MPENSFLLLFLSELAVCQWLTLSSLAADRQDICLMLLTHTTANLSALRPYQHPPSPLAPRPDTPLHTPKWGFGGGAAAKLLCSICSANALRGEGLQEIQRGQNSDVWSSQTGFHAWVCEAQRISQTLSLYMRYSNLVRSVSLTWFH